MNYVNNIFGEHARHVPCWMYIQDQGKGMISFVGASRVDSDINSLHPLRYESSRTHHFITGEIIVRPHLIVATDALIGRGLAGLATNNHDVEHMLSNGEVLLD